MWVFFIPFGRKTVERFFFRSAFSREVAVSAIVGSILGVEKKVASEDDGARAAKKAKVAVARKAAAAKSKGKKKCVTEEASN